MTEKHYKTYQTFYPFYLSQHLHKTCRILHYIGTTLILMVLIFVMATQEYSWLLAMPIFGYFFAWLGHFLFEGNKPATFTYPLWSLLADFHMYFDCITGRLGKKLAKASQQFTQR